MNYQRFSCLLLVLFTVVAVAYDPHKKGAYNPHQKGAHNPHQSSILDVAGAGSPDITNLGTQPGLNFSIDPSSNCSSCHSGSNPGDDDNMPYPTWSGSMMANATRDPLFWAALDVANNDLPGAGDYCLRCHTPNGWYGGRVLKTGDQQNPIEDGTDGCRLQGYHDEADTKFNDYQGINCHFCHRQDETGPNGEVLKPQNANLWVDDQACDNPDSDGFTPCRKGPYSYPYNNNFAPHDWEHSLYIQKGEFCGSCHNVSSPVYEENGSEVAFRTLIDENGVDTGLPMPIERTNVEWESSLFGDLIFRDSLGDDVSTQFPLINRGETCQQCHMPDSDDPSARACFFPGFQNRGSDLAVHEFAGSSTWMPQILKGLYGTALGRSDAYDRTTGYAMEMLQLKSAMLEATPVSSTASELTMNVRVTNLTGHKLPTGYHEGRRMWLHIEARNGSDTVFFESGAYNDATGVLTEDAQIKIYEASYGIWNSGTNNCDITDSMGRKMFHFVLNNCTAKDNRIPPLGFTGGNDIELKPVGYTYPANPEDPDTLVNYDDTTYVIPIAGQAEPITVTATLRFQSVTKEYVEFLANQATENNFQSENDLCNRSLTVGPGNQTRAAFMLDLWNNNGKSTPVDMTTGEIIIGS